MTHGLTAALTNESEALLVSETTSVVALAERAAQSGAPLMLVYDGEPLAALIAVPALADLYAELRCLRTLYAQAIRQEPRR